MVRMADVLVAQEKRRNELGEYIEHLQVCFMGERPEGRGGLVGVGEYNGTEQREGVEAQER